MVIHMVITIMGKDITANMGIQIKPKDIILKNKFIPTTSYSNKDSRTNYSFINSLHFLSYETTIIHY